MATSWLLPGPPDETTTAPGPIIERMKENGRIVSDMNEQLGGRAKVKQ